MSSFAPIRRVRAALTAAMLLFTAGCDDAREDVAAWLACDECQDELGLVRNEGNDALEPLLVALYRGASDPEQRNFIAQAREEFRLADRARTAMPGGVSVLSDVDDYVDDGLTDLLTGNRMRAAWALRALNTPEARAALHQAALDHAASSIGWRSEVVGLVALLDSPRPVTSVALSGPVRALAVNDSAAFTAQVNGPIVVPQAVAWVSTSPAAVTVSANGLVKRIAPGPATVRACATANPSVCGSVVIGMP